MALLGDTTVFIQLLALQNCQEPDGLCWATGLGNTEGCFPNLGHGHYNAEREKGGILGPRVLRYLVLSPLFSLHSRLFIMSSNHLQPGYQLQNSGILFSLPLSSSGSLPHVFRKYSITV